MKKILILFIAQILVIGFYLCQITSALAEVELSEDEALQRLEDIASDMNSSTEEAASLLSETHDLEGNITNLQEELVAVANTLRAHEAELSTLERQLARLESQKTEAEEGLHERRRELVQLIAVMQRLTRLPPEALLARPGDAEEIVETGILLRATLPIIHERSEALRLEITELSEITERLRAGREELISLQENMVVEQQNMQGMLASRQEQLASTRDRRQALLARAEAQAAESGTISEFLTELETDRVLMRHVNDIRIRAQALRENHIEGIGTEEENYILAADLPHNIEPRSRNMIMPAFGQVALHFGDTDNMGSTSMGVHIATRYGATIVSPLEGTVSFAGPFRGYGLLIIIDHNDGFHSIISGLARLDAETGQNLLGGEPIGQMPTSNQMNQNQNNSTNSLDSQMPRLYFELRQDGEPIDPEQIIAENANNG